MDQNAGSHASNPYGRKTYTAQGRTQAQAQADQNMPVTSEQELDSGSQASLRDMATETIEIPITVPRATYETAQAIERTALALMDGWPNASGLMAQLGLITSVALQHLLPAMQRMGDVSADYESNKLQFFDAVSIGLRPIIERYVK